MRDEYIKNYVDGMLLRLSLDALWNHVSWPPEAENALTMTQWGPFYLTGTNAPFIPTFIRTVDRALYHSGNAWRQLAENISNARHIFPQLQGGEVIQTHDRISKYEIEAFLGAVSGITGNNLIGNGKGNRLGKSLGLGEQCIALIRQQAELFKERGVQTKWREIRNSAYHLNPGMHDWGHTATIRMHGGKWVVELTGVHYVEGASPDLVLVFSETFQEFVAFVTVIRDLLLDFSFKFVGVPKNEHYYQAVDKLGNMHVALGPNGFTARHFPETAADFIGPIRGG